MNDQKINGKYILAGITAVVFTWLIHEFTHWLTSEWMGYEAQMYLNKTSLIPGRDPSGIQRAWISISGPIVTILQSLIAFFILKRGSWNKYLYLLIFIAFYMRFLAGLMNFINVNDEGRVSQFLGLGTFSLPIIVSGILFFLVCSTSKKYALSWKFQLGNYLIVMLVSSVLILVDQFLGIRIL